MIVISDESKAKKKKEGGRENSKRMSIPDLIHPVLAEVNADQVKASAPNLDVIVISDESKAKNKNCK